MTDYLEKPILRPWMNTRYRIEVEGNLKLSPQVEFIGLTISTKKRADHSIITTLSGEVANQSVLHQLLSTLFSLHCPILKIENISLVKTSIKVAPDS